LIGAAAMVRAQQQQPMGPPKVLQIFREEVKYGKGPAHTKFESTFADAFRRAKWPTHYLGISSLTGPAEAWFLVGYESFEAWEKDNEATAKNSAFSAELDKLSEQDAAYVNNGRGIMAVYRPDLSYRANINIGEYRYFEIDTVRVRLGRGEEFTQLTKLQVEAHEKLNIEEHWAAYEIVEEGPAGTIVFFTPMKSLKQEDMDHGKQVREAMGDENWKKFEQFGRDGVISDESNIFAFSPKMSYPSDAAVASDPSFWKPKTAGAAAGGAKEGDAAGAKKPPAKQPGKQ
jgi:hypothetical protein